MSMVLVTSWIHHQLEKRVGLTWKLSALARKKIIMVITNRRRAYSWSFRKNVTGCPNSTMLRFFLMKCPSFWNKTLRIMWTQTGKTGKWFGCRAREKIPQILKISDRLLIFLDAVFPVSSIHARATEAAPSLLLQFNSKNRRVRKTFGEVEKI